MKYIVLGLLLASIFVVMTPTASANHCTYTDVADAGLVGVNQCESSYEYGTCAEGEDGYAYSSNFLQVMTPDGSVYVSQYDSCQSSTWGYSSSNAGTGSCASSAAASSYACAQVWGYEYSYSGNDYRQCYMYTQYNTPAGYDYSYEPMDDTVCDAYLGL